MAEPIYTQESVREARRLHVRLSDNPDDIDRLKPLVRDVHLASRFADIPFDTTKLEKKMRQAYTDPRRFAIIVADIDADPVGCITLGVGEYIVGSDVILATVYSYHVHSNIRVTAIGGKVAFRLIRAAVQWARARNAQELMVHVTSGIDIQRTDRFLRRLRFDVIGANYALKLGDQNG